MNPFHIPEHVSNFQYSGPLQEAASSQKWACKLPQFPAKEQGHKALESHGPEQFNAKTGACSASGSLGSEEYLGHPRSTKESPGCT